jgi:hypothetical protein
MTVVVAGGGAGAVAAAADDGVAGVTDDGSTLAGPLNRPVGFARVAWVAIFYLWLRSDVPDLEDSKLRFLLANNHLTKSLTHPHRLTWLRLWLPLPRLNSLLLHRHWSVDVVQLKVQPACIAHRLARIIPPP